MEKRPLFAFGAAYFAGAFAAGLRPWYLTYAVLLGVPVCCAVYAAVKLWGYAGSARGLLLIALLTAPLPVLGYVRCVDVWKERLAEYAEWDGAPVVAAVRIVSPVERRERSWRVEAEALGVTDVDKRTAVFPSAPGTARMGQGKLLLEFRTDGAEDMDTAGWRRLLEYGNRLSVRGRLAKPAPAQNEYLFDYERWLYSRGLVATVYAEPGDAQLMERGSSISPVALGIAVRGRVEGVLLRLLPAREAALLTSILLGGTGGLDEETRRNFTAAGMLHMMAVSGMHIVLAARLTTRLARKAGAGVNAASLAGLAAALMYAFIAGFSASVLRAACAYALAVAAKFLCKAFDGLSAAGLAALALLLINPMQAFSAGFLLSFSAVVSILILAPRAETALKAAGVPKAAASALGAGLAVCCGCFPIQASLFHQYALYSVPANLAAAPLVAAVLASGQLTAITGLISMGLARPASYLTLSLMWPLNALSAAAAGLPGSLARVGAFTPFGFLLYYAALTVAVLAIKGLGGGRWRDPRHIRCAAAICAAFLLVLFVRARVAAGLAANVMEVVFLDVGNANAAYINIGGRVHAVVDAGGKLSFRDEEQNDANTEHRLGDYLRGRGIARVDLAVVTHGDIDHTGGFWDLLTDIPVTRFIAADSRSAGTRDERLLDLLDFARSKGSEVIYCSAGDSLSLGDGAAVEVLSPGPLSVPGWPAAATPNEAALVTRFVFGSARVLFCGDIGENTERGLLARYGDAATAAPERSRDSDVYAGLAAEVMSVPHHGSKYSSCADFIAAVGPELAVIGTGRNNYGHPAPETLARYAAGGAELRRTDRDGMVSVFCGRDGIDGVKCYNDYENLYAWRRR